jgi:light-regulated signal transduction histidine kinase (bacteriophytochrome)
LAGAEQLTDKQLADAMEHCASEPAHIPGTVQPFASLIAVNTASEIVAYASENASEVLHRPVASILGERVRDVLDREIWHAVNNTVSAARTTGLPLSVGRFPFSGSEHDISVFLTQDHIVLEIEKAQDLEFDDHSGLKTLTYMTRQIQEFSVKDELFDLTTNMLRHITGYTRVMIYRFDHEYNGEIISESRSPSSETFLGLRFPHWDIPKQARAIMCKIPLRFIQDVNQDHVSLLAANPDLPPLDITLANSRGVSAVHMEYLRNMKVGSTMTLTLKLGGELWGIISFHHPKPRVPALKLREILINFAELMSVKLQTLLQQEKLALVSKVEDLKQKAFKGIDDNDTIEESFPEISATVMEVMNADGVAILKGSRGRTAGVVPEQAVIDAIVQTLRDQGEDQIQQIESLEGVFPHLASGLNGCAGALAVSTGSRTAIVIFRTETVQSVNWAGNPEKTVEQVDGRARLAPRGSFATYVQIVQGRCAAWTEQDLFFAQQIWTLMNTAERRVLMNTLHRQQSLMIGELNHRVRNILALVRSVSRQARRRYGSLNSYAKSLEARIQALAAAHDLASGKQVGAIGIHQLIQQEIEPFSRDQNVLVEGPNRSIRADLAPVFSLVIHELATNAAKYGSLSNDSGKVSILISELQDGLQMTWRETGGPKVKPVEEKGFGSVLIEQAIPHEMGGMSTLKFAPKGIEAQIQLPNTVFEDLVTARPVLHDLDDAILEVPLPDLKSVEGLFLVLEDNFIIAKEMSEQLEDFGAKEIETLSNDIDAMELLKTVRPVFSILDVNLNNGATSEKVAEKLLELELPFIFVTGYGDEADLPSIFSSVPKLSKPVSNTDLQIALKKFVDDL